MYNYIHIICGYFFSIIIYTCEHIVNPWHPVTVLNTPCKFKAAITRYQGFRWCWHWPWWHWWSHTYPVPTPQAACDPGVRIAGLWLGSCSIWWFATKFHTALFTDFISIPGLLWVVRAAFPGWLNLEEYIIVRSSLWQRYRSRHLQYINVYPMAHAAHAHAMPCDRPSRWQICGVLLLRYFHPCYAHLVWCLDRQKPGIRHKSPSCQSHSWRRDWIMIE